MFAGNVLTLAVLILLAATVLRMFRPDFKAEGLPVRHRRPTRYLLCRRSAGGSDFRSAQLDPPA
jgi:hypothetical protein